MDNPESSRSEIFQLGKAVANTCLLALIILATVGLPLLGLEGLLQHTHGEEEGVILLMKQTYWTLHSFGVMLLTNPLYYAGFPVLLALQLLRPAIARKRLPLRALATDMIWMVVYTLTWVAFFAVFLEGAKHLLAPVIRIAQVGVLSALPQWAAILLGYLFAEFLGWLGHLIRHKVTLFWFFHEVHHSQTEMNPFTSYRVHPVDDLIAQAISLLPAIFFEHTLGIALFYLSIFRLHDALIHSNIRTNLGWLRFVVMSPQAHRVHHSLDPRYYDTNMGVTLCIWDRIFGIYSTNEQVYDETGTSDAQFPLETKAPLSRWFLTVPAQLLYPYRKAIRYVVELYPWARVMRQSDSMRAA